MVSGSPPATQTTISGSTNGTSYNFSVTATNAIGTSAASTLSNTITPTAVPPPAFVQGVTSYAVKKSSLAVTPTSNLGSGRRLIVQVGVWEVDPGATASSMTDAAGDQFTEVQHFTASDRTELSVWTAVVGAGAGTKPAITVTTTSAAHIGVTASASTPLSGHD